MSFSNRNYYFCAVKPPSIVLTGISMRRFYSKLAHNILTFIIVASTTILGTSCIDDAYDLNNISTEITVGGDVVTLPLANIAEKSLGEIIGDKNTELVDEDGVYKIKYSGDNDTFTVDGITMPTIEGLSPAIDPITFTAPAVPDYFEFSRTETPVMLDYPDIDPKASVAAISISKEIDTGIQMPSGNIPALGQQHLQLSGSESFSASFDIPEEIQSVSKVYFGEDASVGSPVSITLALNGLKSIVGDGSVDISVTFPSGYELTDGRGTSLGNTFTVDGYRLTPGSEKTVFTTYLRSIDLTGRARSGAVAEIDDSFEYALDVNFEAVEGYYNASFAPALEISAAPQYNDMQVVTNTIHIENASQTTPVTYTFNGIPESISSIDRIAFDNAPITVSIEGVEWLESDIITTTVRLPEGFALAPDADGYLDAASNTITAPLRDLENGLRFMLTSIDCTKCEAELKGGQLTLQTEISASIDDLPAGKEIMLSKILPETTPVTMTAIVDGTRFTIDLADSEVSMREQYFDFNLDESNYPRINKVIDIPDEIATIDRLQLATPDGGQVKATVTASIPDGTIFPVDEVELNFSVNLKQMIVPAAGQSNVYTAENGDRILNIGNLTWRPNDTHSIEIASVVLDAIENLPEITGSAGNRTLSIDEMLIVTGGVSTAAGTDVNLEAENARINIDFHIDDAVITEFTGTVDYKVTPDAPVEIDLGNIADYDLQLDNLAIDPIIRVNVANPIDVPFDATLTLTPYDLDDNVMTDNIVSVEGIRIAGAGTTNLVISTEERRAQFEGDNSITFAAADIDRLLHGSIPARIVIDLEVASDTSESHTIDLTEDKYTITYGYSVEIPLEFGSSLDISYEGSVDGLSGNFSDISDKHISVGEIAILAEFTTTIPLDMVLSASFYDVDGNETEAKAILDGNCIIKGYNPSDGDKGTTSTVEIRIDLGEGGDLSLINDIDALRFKINLRNNSSSLSSLNSTQKIYGQLKVRIKDGITVDLEDITKK